MISHQTSATPLELPSPETVDAICPRHGAYVARVIDTTAIGGSRFPSRCPACAESAQRETEARQQAEQAAARQRRIAQLNERSGIPARFASRTFAGYDASLPGQKIAAGVCKAYAEKWGENYEHGRSLVLTGLPGTGKTHLACSIAGRVMAEHLASCYFTPVASMLRLIKETYRKDSTRTEQQAIDSLLEPDLLILDEVGVQVGSDHEKLLMFEVLNDRYQEMRPTILISNLTADELETFLGQRVMDRYRECGSVIAFDWQSHRGQR